MRWLRRLVTHALAAAAGFGLGIYALPILIAPDGPSDEALQQSEQLSLYTGEFRRDLPGSDALHWGEGRVFVTENSVALQGRLAPGPDYRLYLSPVFVDSEAAFEAQRARMVDVGAVRSFENFLVSLPGDIHPSDYSSVIVWCESFGEFITAAAYR